MSATQAILALVGLVCTGLGWWMNDLWQAHKALRQELADFKALVPDKYVAKEEYREDVREMKQTLRDIWAQLGRLTGVGGH